MDVKELRIGNLIIDSINNRTGSVMRLNCGIDYPITYNYNKAFECTPKNGEGIDGIAINEKILIDAGFNYDDDEHEFMSLEIYAGLKIHSDISDQFSICTLVLNRKMTIGIKYVHHLQNIWRDLKGEELKIKQK